MSTRATAVSSCLRCHSSGAHGVEQRRAVAVGARQLDIETRRQGHRRGVLGIDSESVVVGELADGEVVGHDEAGEPPLLAQDAAQQLAVGRRRNAVELDVGVHHRAQAGGTHDRLERMEVDLAELALTEVGRRPVEPALRGAVADEVLGGRDHPGA